MAKANTTEKKFTVKNPEANAPIDTIVEGQRYQIAGNETVDVLTQAHADFLKETYPFLEVSGAAAAKAPAPASAAKATDDGTAPAPKAAAKAPAKKAAAKSKAKSKK